MPSSATQVYTQPPTTLGPPTGNDGGTLPVTGLDLLIIVLAVLAALAVAFALRHASKVRR